MIFLIDIVCPITYPPSMRYSELADGSASRFNSQGHIEQRLSLEHCWRSPDDGCNLVIQFKNLYYPNCEGVIENTKTWSNKTMPVTTRAGGGL